MSVVRAGKGCLLLGLGKKCPMFGLEMAFEKGFNWLDVDPLEDAGSEVSGGSFNV